MDPTRSGGFQLRGHIAEFSQRKISILPVTVLRHVGQFCIGLAQVWQKTCPQLSAVGWCPSYGSRQTAHSFRVGVCSGGGGGETGDCVAGEEDEGACHWWWNMHGLFLLKKPEQFWPRRQTGRMGV